MNSERKNYPMKEFRAIFPVSSILVIRSAYAKKNHFSILAVFQNLWDLHKFGFQIWIQNAKITLWKNFGQFFKFHRFSCKKDHFSILAVIQNVWYLHKFGLKIWIQNAKITLWKSFGKFFRFHRFWSSGPGMQKKDHFSILAVIQNIWDLHNLGCRFEFRTQKLPYETISGNFSDFIDFVIRSWYAKNDHFSILAVIQNIWDLHKFGLQIWIHNAQITLWKNFGNFSDFIDFGHQVRVCKKGHFPILAVFQNVWDLHKFGLQIWIQNAKITLLKNFRQFFQFHRFWLSGPGMRKKVISQY